MEKLGLDDFLCLFDLDGTLIASDSKIYKAVEETRKQLGYQQLPIDSLTSRIGLPAKELFYDLDLGEAAKEAAVAVFREKLSRIEFTNQDLFPGIYELLTILNKAKCHLMVATNKPKHLAEIALSGAGIDSFFSFISGGDNLPTKPDPAILLACMTQSDRKSTVMIGDRTDDIRAALSVGAIPVGIAQGVHSSLELINAGAYAVFRNATELLSALHNGWGFGDL